MINRGLNKNSQYIFNSTTGMLEKIADKALTIESLSKQVNNLSDIADIVNKEEKQEPVNNIVVITADDNLIHNYFYDLDVSWDASNCLASAIIKMPKMNDENTNYWATYHGQLTIYMGYNFNFDKVNEVSYNSEQEAVNSISRYWDNSDIKPFFRGEISHIKELDSSIILYVDNIGRRFQQKIPEEFRQAYINNQNVRDAFQAICEFLGVQYICPPKTVMDNGQTEQSDNTTVQHDDASDKTQQEQQIANVVNNLVNSANENNDEENNTNTDLTNNQEINKPQNGYQNINFDSNGAIVFGSTVIETSPDMADTLLAMEENPLEKYIDDDTGIIEKVQALLDGDMFEELHNKVMNYDAITIQPKAASTSFTETVNTEPTEEESEQTTETENN